MPFSFSKPNTSPMKKKKTSWWLCLALFLFCLVFVFVSPKLPHRPDQHLFADMRNLIGVPNTLNVLTTFPFLLVGVVGFVFCLFGDSLGISVKGEIWGWLFFYMGMVGLGFGSAYYHLNPDDARVIWDQLPMMVTFASLFSVLVIERVNNRLGVACLFSLITLIFAAILYERAFHDLRICMALQFIPCLGIPTTILLFPSKYTHSGYWFLAAGFYLLAKFEAMYDHKVYRVNHYVISGHSLGHLCLAATPLMLIVMLWFRNLKISRNS